MIQKIVIGIAVIFILITGYFTCLSSSEPVEMCVKQGGCWNVQANECEFEDMSKCK